MTRNTKSMSERLIKYTERDDAGNVISPAVIKCDCGNKLEVWRSRDVLCDHCHREYNCFGQLLAPRSQWGEETGESLSDILNGGNEE